VSLGVGLNLELDCEQITLFVSKMENLGTQAIYCNDHQVEAAFAGLYCIWSWCEFILSVQA
jgi:hypothetical protein